LAVRGVVAIIFGILALIWTRSFALALVILFGIYAIIDGIALLVADARHQTAGRNRGWMLFEGLVSILAGIVAFTRPGILALTVLFVIAVWAILTGVAEIVPAVELRGVLKNDWLLAIDGVLSVLLGVLLFIFPGAGLLTLVWLIGIYAIIFGVLMVGLAFRIRGMSMPSKVAGAALG
jgi:uncharacterized membrane protein HdeD (DUF308 family)